MDGRKPLSALAYGFLTMLPDRVDDLDASAADKVAEQAVDLAALALATERSQADITLASSRAVALTVLKAAIEARLHEALVSRRRLRPLPPGSVFATPTRCSPQRAPALNAISFIDGWSGADAHWRTLHNSDA